MTGMLHDLLHERADDLGAPHVDLATITRDGDRRVRRRRTALAGGLAAAVVAVAGGVAVLGGGAATSPDTRRDRVADGTDAAPVALSWVTGSTLHRAGQPDVDLGVGVRAWVWAGDDVVFTDAQRRVRVWSGDALDVVGTSADVVPDREELLADGTRVAWLGADGAWHVVDTATGQTDSDGAGPYRADATRSQVTAFDGTTVYGIDARGIVAWDSATGEVSVLDQDAGRAVIDADGGVLLRAVGDRKAEVTGGGSPLTLTVDSFANLSPDGGHVVAESDDVGLLLDTATGFPVLLATSYGWELPFQWLDDDTVAVLAYDTEDPQERDVPRLLSCTVSTGECGSPITLDADFQLPVGIHLDT